jgi:hypothetical protein
MKSIKTLTTAVVGLILSVATSQATFYNLPVPSGAVPTTASYTPAGTLVLEQGPQISVYSQGSGAFSGTVTSWALSGDTSNPLGGLDFLYQIHNTGSTQVEGLSLGGFDSIVVDVGYITTAVLPVATGSVAGTIIPADATRSLSTIHWDYIGTSFTGGGTYGDILVVLTGMTGWEFANGSIQDTYSQNIQILAVPEPTTMVAGALLLLPFGASTLRILRKNRTA